MRNFLGLTRDSIVFQALRDVQSAITVGPDGRVPQLDQSHWDAMEEISIVAMERFSLRDRLPETPLALVAEELAEVDMVRAAQYLVQP
jgi:hypothetical protein